jgi:hypothetical protein
LQVELGRRRARGQQRFVPEVSHAPHIFRSASAAHHALAWKMTIDSVSPWATGGYRTRHDVPTRRTRG